MKQKSKSVQLVEILEALLILVEYTNSDGEKCIVQGTMTYNSAMLCALKAHKIFQQLN
jgi:hypothetical protein